MPHALFVTILLSCLAHSALAGGQPIKDAPSEIRLPPGNSVKVLSITRTTLHGSDEPAVAVQYVSEISLSDTDKLYSQAEQVFQAIRPIASERRCAPQSSPPTSRRVVLLTCRAARVGVGSSAQMEVGANRTRLITREFLSEGHE